MRTYPNISLIFFGFVFTLLTFSSCTDEESPYHAQINAGQSAAGISLGDTFGDVKSILGSGQEDAFTMGDKTIYSLVYNDLGLTFYSDALPGQKPFKDDFQVIQISLFGAYEGKTPEGISIGSTEMEVLATYGDPDQTAAGIYDYAQGIEFAVENGLVRDISIYQ